MTNTNEEHKQIDEDEPWIDEDQAPIEEKKMREFERRNPLSVNEWCRWILNPYFTILA